MSANTMAGCWLLMAMRVAEGSPVMLMTKHIQGLINNNKSSTKVVQAQVHKVNKTVKDPHQDFKDTGTQGLQNV